MKKLTGVLIALVLVVGVLVPTSAATAQERVIVETRSATVLKVVGRTVVIRNDLGEIKQYTDLPEDVTLTIEGKPAKLSDLKEGMTLNAVRWENVPPPVIVTMEEVEMIKAPAPAPAPAPKPSPAPAPKPMPAPAPKPAQLPSTASQAPTLALVGLAFLAVAGLVAVSRRRR